MLPGPICTSTLLLATEIVSGPLNEQTRWVEGTYGEMVYVVEHMSVEKSNNNAQHHHIKVAYAQYLFLELKFLADI